jgi:branched-chain amino acid aminotransferase
MFDAPIWKNGEIVPATEATVSIYDSAMMFGDTAFEMMRTFNKQTFKLREHLERLFTSLKILEIEIPYTLKDIYNAHENLIIHNRYHFKEDDEIRTLINVTRGLLPIYDFIGESSPTVTITAFPLRNIVKGMGKWYKQGVRAIVATQRAIPEQLLDPKIKSRSRQHYQMANLGVKRQDRDAWPILLDPDGFIAESSGSNIFLIRNNKLELWTPEGRNCLRGISRAYVMELAKKLGLGMKVIEKNLTVYDLYEASEVFFTCTPFSIMPCTKVNGKWIGSGKVGHKTKQLQEAWSRSVSMDIVKQIKDWDD